MRGFPTWGLLLLLGACEARINAAPPEQVTGVDAALLPDPTPDAPVDASIESPPPPPPPDAPPVLGAWSAAQKVGVAATAATEDDVTLSSNALEMVFAIANGDPNGKDLYYTSRPSLAGAWTTAVKLDFNSTTSDEAPRFSADDKTLYYGTGRAGNGTLDIYKVTRAAAGSTTWSAPEPLAAVNTTTLSEKWFMPCGTDHYVMVQNPPNGSFDLVEGTLGGAAPTLITELNSAQNDTSPFLTQDCLTIYFASSRANPTLIYVSQRASLTTPWSAPKAMLDFAVTGGDQEDPWLSPDGRIFAFASDAAGRNNKDVYLSTR